MPLDGVPGGDAPPSPLSRVERPSGPDTSATSAHAKAELLDRRASSLAGRHETGDRVDDEAPAGQSQHDRPGTGPQHSSEKPAPGDPVPGQTDRLEAQRSPDASEPPGRPPGAEEPDGPTDTTASTASAPVGIDAKLAALDKAAAAKYDIGDAGLPAGAADSSATQDAPAVEATTPYPVGVNAKLDALDQALLAKQNTVGPGTGPDTHISPDTGEETSPHPSAEVTQGETAPITAQPEGVSDSVSGPGNGGEPDRPDDPGSPPATADTQSFAPAADAKPEGDFPADTDAPSEPLPVPSDSAGEEPAEVADATSADPEVPKATTDAADPDQGSVVAASSEVSPPPAESPPPAGSAETPPETPSPDAAPDVSIKLDKRLTAIYADSTETPAGRAFFHPDDEILISSLALPPEPGYYTVDLHGSPDGFFYEDERLDAEELSRLIRADERWDHQPVRLFSCETGQGDDPIAQVVSDELDVTVLAPTELAWAYPSGEIFTTSSSGIDDFGNPIETVPYDGHWREFNPTKSEEH